MEMLTIGQLSKATGLTTVTIRYYEKCGLLPKLKRSPGGYRLYPNNLIPRFYFIQNAKSVGFDLTEIKELLALQAHQASSQEVKKRTQTKIAEIKKKIKALETMKQALSKLEKACDGKIDIDQCPILKNLYLPTDPT